MTELNFDTMNLIYKFINNYCRIEINSKVIMTHLFNRFKEINPKISISSRTFNAFIIETYGKSGVIKKRYRDGHYFVGICVKAIFDNTQFSNNMRLDNDN